MKRETDRERAGNNASPELAKKVFRLDMALSALQFWADLNLDIVLINKQAKIEQQRASKKLGELREIKSIFESLDQFDGQELSQVSSILETDLKSCYQQASETKDSAKKDALYDEAQNIEAAIRFLETQYQTTFERADYKTWHTRLKKAQVDQTDNQDQTELNEIREDIEAQFLEEILKKSGSYVNTSVPSAYSAKNTHGFQGLVDAQRADEGVFTNQATMFGRFREHETEFQKEGVHEAVAIERLIHSYPKPIEEKSGWFGKKTVRYENIESNPNLDTLVKGAGSEDAFVLRYRTYDNYEGLAYKDYSGRTGQFLAVELIMPESIAKQLGEQIKKDPSIVRRLIKKIVIEKSSIPENAWETGNKSTNGVPIKPPYEAWRETEQGRERIYIEIDQKGEIRELKTQ